MTQNLLEDTRIIGFLEAYRGMIRAKWENSATPEEREELHRMFITSKSFEVHLRSFILDEKLAEMKEATNG